MPGGCADEGRFDAAFARDFERLLAWRRDVRRFRSDPLREGTLDELVRLAALAPSVGYSQPGRFVRVRSSTRRGAVVADFERTNAAAADGYDADRRAAYAALKLAGLREAPEHLAVFADTATEHGAGLGRRTMPETLAYSAVTARSSTRPRSPASSTSRRHGSSSRICASATRQRSTSTRS